MMCVIVTVEVSVIGSVIGTVVDTGIVSIIAFVIVPFVRDGSSNLPFPIIRYTIHSSLGL